MDCKAKQAAQSLQPLPAACIYVDTMLQIGNQKDLKMGAQEHILIPAKAVILIGMQREA